VVIMPQNRRLASKSQTGHIAKNERATRKSRETRRLPNMFLFVRLGVPDLALIHFPSHLLQKPCVTF